MITVKFNSTQFMKDMKNITGYAEGFIQGAELGKINLMENIGREVVAELKEYIDINARVNPMSLHHVYEWHQTGSPAARLFDIDYIATNNGLSINSTFRQSVSIRKGSTVPFYNKASVMENGVPVRIEPRSAQALVFEKDGETIFTKKPINVIDPGGETVQGGYERVFDTFFNQYFTQSFLRHSGIMQNLENAAPFKANLSKAKTGGKSAGISVGYKWISKKGSM